MTKIENIPLFEVQPATLRGGVVRNTVWIVEVNFGEGRGWEATMGCRLTRDAARIEAKEYWQSQGLRTRLVKYTPASASTPEPPHE